MSSMTNTPVQERPEWQALCQAHDRLANTSTRELFEQDPERSDKYRLNAAGWTLDFSRQRIDAEALSGLHQLARSCQVCAQRDALFSGAIVNQSEQRPALHTALRNRSTSPVILNGSDVMPAVRATLVQMRAFCDQVLRGQLLGATGQPITHIVNVGIGGSDLGPRMATRALRGFRTSLDVRFVANMDPNDLDDLLVGLNPAETLFIIASKSFGTAETLQNAHRARAWLVDAIDETAVAKHFVAISSRADRVSEFGIDADTRMFSFADWVGGRYSLWSPIGLSLMLAIGPDNFDALLAGAEEIDQHFLTAEPEQNLPLMMGLLAVWNHSLGDAQSHAVMPYSQRLALLPHYLQQLEMESNGKTVDQFGQPVSVSTAPIIWGAVGSNGQHAFHQLLHLGNQSVSADFIGFRQTDSLGKKQHAALLANLLGQSSALAFGVTQDELRAEGVSEDNIPHRRVPGNRPHSLLIADQLTPHSLGAFLAAWEHRVFVQAAIWGINPFDQWGVELGKTLADGYAGPLQSEGESPDSFSQTLVADLRRR